MQLFYNGQRKQGKPHKLINQFFIIRKGRLALLVFTVFILLLPSGCQTIAGYRGAPNEKDDYLSQSDFLLNTVITINLYDKQDATILNGCFDLIKMYENIFSRTSKSSELYALNHNAVSQRGRSFQISEELTGILSYGLYYSKLSGGAFDISVEPITSLWDFKTEEPELPNPAKLKDALKFVNYESIQLNGNKISYAVDGVGIDLGAIAKGYIADRVKDYLISKGVKSALINLGGNVLCIGVKPDGTPFRIGIQKPYADRNETIATIDIKDLSVVSSGVYERYFILDGISYHHILNPDTGYPYDNGLVSVTIISKKSVDGDGLSTTCFALGLEKGLNLIASIPDTYAVFITQDDSIYYSNGFEEAFSASLQQ